MAMLLKLFHFQPSTASFHQVILGDPVVLGFGPVLLKCPASSFPSHPQGYLVVCGKMHLQKTLPGDTVSSVCAAHGLRLYVPIRSGRWGHATTEEEGYNESKRLMSHHHHHIGMALQTSLWEPPATWPFHSWVFPHLNSPKERFQKREPEACIAPASGFVPLTS